MKATISYRLGIYHEGGSDHYGLWPPGARRARGAVGE